MSIEDREQCATHVPDLHSFPPNEKLNYWISLVLLFYSEVSPFTFFLSHKETEVEKSYKVNYRQADFYRLKLYNTTETRFVQVFKLDSVFLHGSRII